MSHQDSGIQLNIEFFNQTGDFIIVNVQLLRRTSLGVNIKQNDN